MNEDPYYVFDICDYCGFYFSQDKLKWTENNELFCPKCYAINEKAEEKYHENKS